MWAYAHLPFLQNPRKLLRQRRREGTAGEITQFPGKLRKREDRRVKKLVRQVVLLLCPAIQDGISVLMVPQNRMADEERWARI